MENSLLSLIWQSRQVAFALTDRDLVIQELHGQPEIVAAVMKDGLGRSLLDLFPELLGNQPDLAAILAGKLGNLQLVYVNREAGDRTIYLTMDDLPYRDESGNIVGLVHVVQDETVKGELEQQLTQNRNELRLLNERIESQNRQLIAANIELKRLGDFKAQFVQMATYELRKTLKSLNGYIKMLQGGQLGPLTDSQAELLKIIQANGLRVRSMTDELLGAVRLDSSQIDLELKPVDLVGLVNTVVTENTAQIQAKNQVLNLEFHPGLPPALCDEDWTKQIVANLLSNASKTTPEGGHISIAVKPAEQAGYLQLSVADSGAGSPSGGQEGLYITRSLVELVGCSIELEPRQNLGSVIEVTLPVAR